MSKAMMRDSMSLSCTKRLIPSLKLSSFPAFDPPPPSPSEKHRGKSVVNQTKYKNRMAMKLKLALVLKRHFPKGISQKAFPKRHFPKGISPVFRHLTVLED
jgi:hypothetical protein